MDKRTTLRYGGLYLTAGLFVAALTVASLIQASAAVHQALDLGVLFGTFCLLAMWVRTNYEALCHSRMQGWNDAPFIRDTRTRRHDG